MNCDGCLTAGWHYPTTVTADVTQMPTYDDYSAFYDLWDSGKGPDTINYGQNDGMTQALANSWTFDKLRLEYKKQGCPNSGKPIPGGNHLDPFLEGYLPSSGPMGPGPQNWALAQVGGFVAYGSTSGDTTTFTIKNVAGQASFSGASTVGERAAKYIPYLSHHGVKDNPYGKNGPRHNILQVFTWTEKNACGSGG